MTRRIFFIIFAGLAIIGLGRDLFMSFRIGDLTFLSLGEFWFRLDPSSLNGLQVLLQRYIASWLWDPVIVFILQKPTWVVPLIMSALLWIVGRVRS